MATQEVPHDARRLRTLRSSSRGLEGLCARWVLPVIPVVLFILLQVEFGSAEEPERYLGQTKDAAITDGHRTPITSYSNFADDACTAFVVGYTESSSAPKVLSPTLGHYHGQCNEEHKPILFSVTHENEQNSHRGAANFDPRISAYMADLDYNADLGNWVDFGFGATDGRRVLSIRLDTLNYRKVNVTGWPLQFGHLFASFSDRTVDASLDKGVFVEFDLRVRALEGSPSDGLYSGQRVMVGTVGKWTEAPPRTNKSHFFEVDLFQSDGYSASYKEPQAKLCNDVHYDRCFYSVDGTYAEGREIRYQTQSDASRIRLNTIEWTHIRIPLSDAIRKLRWVSGPGTWSDGRLSGLYVGIESTGATRTWIEIRNYRVYIEGTGMTQSMMK
jgi:hypothetical protein